MQLPPELLYPAAERHVLQSPSPSHHTSSIDRHAASASHAACVSRFVPLAHPAPPHVGSIVLPYWIVYVASKQMCWAMLPPANGPVEHISASVQPVGISVGDAVGVAVAMAVGEAVGEAVGNAVGYAVGAFVGDAVG